jgi:hypothetical protein
MTALAALLLHLLLGFVPIQFHDVPPQNGLSVHCTDQGACVDVDGLTIEPTLPAEVLP